MSRSPSRPDVAHSASYTVVIGVRAQPVAAEDEAALGAKIRHATARAASALAAKIKEAKLLETQAPVPPARHSYRWPADWDHFEQENCR